MKSREQATKYSISFIFATDVKIHHRRRREKKTIMMMTRSWEILYMRARP
jgi:hypothetical protein